MITLNRKRRCTAPTSKQWDGKTYDLKTIDYGGSGIVLFLDDSSVVKVPLAIPRCVRDFETEREVYRRVAKSKYSCPYILQCYNFTHPRGIILEKMEYTVRNYIWQMKEAPNEDDTLRWATQAARGLTFLHKHGVVQADVGCHNMLLSSDKQLKLCDFSGCSIDGKPSTVYYELRSQLQPHRPADRRTDIFALGSAMYEMSTGREPYEDLPECEVKRRFEDGILPDDFSSEKHQSIYTIIKACWTGELESMKRVVTHLEYIAQHRSSAIYVGFIHGPSKGEGYMKPDRQATMTRTEKVRKIGVLEWVKRAAATCF
jgi:serine/threonine protein kinase